MKIGKLREVTLTGSRYQIGKQAGEGAADVIHRMVRQHHKERLSRKDDAFKSALHRLEKNTRRMASELLEEIHGIADGCGLPFEEILAYNCLTEMVGVPVGGCTNFAFADTEVCPAIAKTNDGDTPGLDWFYLIERIYHNDGRGLLIVTWAGTVWLVAGVNSHGLAITGASCDGTEENWDGLPTNMLTRLALERCRSVEEAVPLLSGTPITLHSMNITLADSGGALVVLEKSPTDCALRRPKNSAIFCVNHFLTPGMFARNNNYGRVYLENSERRQRHLTEVLFRPDTEHSVKKMEEILKDGKSPGAVCQLGQENFYTALAAILLPKPKVMKVVLGPPCEGEFQEYRL